VEEPRKRPPRPKRPRELLRTWLELGAAAVLAIVVLTLLASCSTRAASGPHRRRTRLSSRRRRTSPPSIPRSPDARSVGARVRDVRQARQLPGGERVSREPARAGGGDGPAEDLARPPHYRFEIRPGWRLSNGDPVTARSFTRAFQRARSEELVSPAAPYLREVSSWQVHGRTLTIHLRAPAPDFTQRLALPYFCAVPRGRRTGRATRCRRGPVRDRALPHAGRSSCAATRTTTGRAGDAATDRLPLRRVLVQIRLQLEQGEADYGVVTPSAFAALAQRFKGDGGTCSSCNSRSSRTSH